MCKLKMKLSAFMLTAVMTATCGLPAMAFADDTVAPEPGNDGFNIVIEETTSGEEADGTTVTSPEAANPEGELPGIGGTENTGTENTGTEGEVPDTDTADSEKKEAPETLPEVSEPSEDKPETTGPEAIKPEETAPPVEETAPAVPETDVPLPEAAPVPEVPLEELLAEDAVLVIRHIITSDGTDYIDEATVSDLKEGDVVIASDYARVSVKGVEYVGSDEAVTLAAGENVIELHYVLCEGYKIVKK